MGKKKEEELEYTLKRKYIYKMNKQRMRNFEAAVVLIVECSHTFMGTSVQRELVFQKTVKYTSKTLQKRVETLNVTVPYYVLQGGYIQGILAYDLTNSGASANITSGGLGYSHVNIRMKSDKGKELHYDVYVYA